MKAWHTEIGAVAAVIDDQIPPVKHRIPIAEARFLENVSVNLSRGLPVLVQQPRHDRIFRFAAAGPSLSDYLDELTGDVYASNGTFRWLLEQGIRPRGHIFFDPKPEMTDYLTGEAVEYYVAAHCDPALLDRLKNHDVTVVVSPCRTSMDTGVCDRYMERCPPDAATVIGGTMTPLRVPHLAYTMGYRHTVIYGMDGCVGDRDYVYDKTRREPRFDVSFPRGETFRTTFHLGDQARQMIKWRDLMSGMIEIEVRGGGLVATALRYEDEREKPTVRIRPDFPALTRTVHSPAYAADVAEWASIFEAEFSRSPSVLDYGSGANSPFPLAFDPFVAGLDAEPAPADIVLCIGVLESVEPDCIGPVLDHIKALTKHMAFFHVNTRWSGECLADGRNEHLTQRPFQWWWRHLIKRFEIMTGDEKPGAFAVLCRPWGADE